MVSGTVVITSRAMSAYCFILRHLVHHHPERSQQALNDFVGIPGIGNLRVEPEVRAVAWRVTHEPGKPLLDRNFDNVGDRITVVGSILSADSLIWVFFLALIALLLSVPTQPESAS